MRGCLAQSIQTAAPPRCSEVGRAFGQLLKQGWKPRRSILLCSWDAEEQGLIGSTEWVEENAAELKEKAVAYLNVDVAVSGPNFGAPECHRFGN